MVEPSVRIRPFQSSDDKLSRFVIGKANMESLAVANNRAYFHPLTLSVWIVFSGIFIQQMQWWPDANEYGLIGYLRPLPAFAAVAVPLMFLIDWLNRPYFETEVENVLRRADIPDISAYYSRSPSSGFWILEHGDLFVGLIALDASLDSGSDDPASPKTTKKGPPKGTSPSAKIRHFYVDEAYRGSNIQDDLLSYAVQFAFRSDPSLQRITATDSQLLPYVQRSLRKLGFELLEHTGKVGVFGWILGKRVLERKYYEKSEVVES